MSNLHTSTCCECREEFTYPKIGPGRVKCDRCKDATLAAANRHIHSTCGYCGNKFSYTVKRSRVGGRPRTICPECVLSRRAEKRRNEVKRYNRSSPLVLVPPERSLGEMRRTGLTADERQWLRHQMSDRAKVRAVREDSLGRINGI